MKGGFVYTPDIMYLGTRGDGMLVFSFRTCLECMAAKPMPCNYSGKCAIRPLGDPGFIYTMARGGLLIIWEEGL